MWIGLLIAVIVGEGYFASACQGRIKPRETSEPTEERSALPQVVSASGEVLPTRWAVLSFPMGGEVEELRVEANDEVEKRELLVRLKATELGKKVDLAEAALATAQSRLAQVKAGARPQEIAAADQEVAAAKAARDQAQAALEKAKIGQDAAQAAVKLAQTGVASAQAGVTSAEANLALLKAGAREEEREIAKLQIDQARNSLWAAQAQRDSTSGAVDRGEMRQADLDAAEAEVGNAHVAIQIAELRHEETEAGPRAEEIAQAQSGVDSAKAGVSEAKARIDSAQAQLRGAEAQVPIAEAQLAAAEARVAQAQAQRDLLKAGARAEDVAVAEAQVEEAGAALEAAKTSLADAQLEAPFDGTVARLETREGEMVSPGEPILYLGDLSSFQVKTTDLDEIDIARVEVGQQVELTFDALPERRLTGRVKRIEPMATPGRGGTNYTVVISFDKLDPDLRWGMTAFVDILVRD
ncbi:MAG: efflux RND transporter periplasmic adaptor subunit, partial [Chloroflexota bacterium]|nr:efflux RND transporter periplasmic adaptor subunit [Chloroflexota bacterium]